MGGAGEVDYSPAVVPSTEQQLVANPNCVAFATEADRLFGADDHVRSWGDLQRLAADVVLAFHGETGLPTLAGYAWRVALTRRNDRITQGLLYIALDGPATAAHLDALERSVQGLDLGFGPGSVERVPVNGAPAVIASEGRACGVWSREEGDAEPWLRRIERDGPAVRGVIVRASEARADDVCDGLDQIVGVPAPYGEAEREIERMRLSFALRFTRRIVEADGVVREGETEFLATVFPPDLVRRLGLDEQQLQDEYYEAARDQLRVVLGYHDKLALVGLFFSACFSDGSLDAREMRLLKDAGETLGLTREQVVKYLRRFW
ncbi:MAG: TerB family tellurite resistance protein [Myxococcota bacterium]